MLFNKFRLKDLSAPSLVLKLATLSLATLNLAACATTQPATSTRTESFGKAVSANLAAQIVAPTDAQKANTHIPANRARRKLAYDAYETDQVKKLPDAATTNGG